MPNAALRVRIAGVEPEATASARGRATAPRRRAGSFSLLAAGPGAGRARPTRALRERLVEGLQLDAAQQAQLDAVLAEMRPDFMALGGFPEEQRAARASS